MSQLSEIREMKREERGKKYGVHHFLPKDGKS